MNTGTPEQDFQSKAVHTNILLFVQSITQILWGKQPSVCAKQAIRRAQAWEGLLKAQSPSIWTGESLLEAGMYVLCGMLGWHASDWASKKNRKRWVASVVIASKEGHLRGGLFELCFGM